MNESAATKSGYATAIDAFDKRMSEIGGCGDGYCLVTGKATGMHTNGGCHCWSNKYTAQRVMGASRSLRDQVSQLVAGSHRSDNAVLADKLERLCCAETEGKFFDCVTDNIATIIKALRHE